MLTFPVTNVCCERSLSSFRRLKPWERATMGEERMCGLVMLHVHRDMTKRDTRKLEHCILNDNSCIQIISTTCIALCRTSVEFILICFFH